MKRSLITFLVALVCVSVVGISVAQDITTARPMFKTLPPHNYFPNEKQLEPAAQLPQWTFNWTSSFDNRQFSSVIVGTNPSTTNTTTTVTVGVIPIVMVYGASNGNKTFDPTTPYFKNFSTVQMIED